MKVDNISSHCWCLCWICFLKKQFLNLTTNMAPSACGVQCSTERLVSICPQRVRRIKNRIRDWVPTLYPRNHGNATINPLLSHDISDHVAAALLLVCTWNPTMESLSSSIENSEPEIKKTANKLQNLLLFITLEWRVGRQHALYVQIETGLTLK